MSFLPSGNVHTPSDHVCTDAAVLRSQDMKFECGAECINY